MVKILVFALGACLGSFISALMARRRLGISIIKPNSFCESCGQRIRAYDLIPIVSFIILRGRCRFCKSKISYKTFLTEILGGLLFLISFNIYEGFRALVLCPGLIIGLLVALTDHEYMEIYDIDCYILIGIGVLYRLIYLGFSFRFFKILLIFTLVFLLIRYLSKGGLGDGDLFFYLGLFLFLETRQLTSFILLSLWIGAIFAIIKSIKIRSLKGEIALCPSILLAFVSILILG